MYKKKNNPVYFYICMPYLWEPVGKCGILKILYVGTKQKKKKLKNDMLIYSFLVMRDILVTR